MGNAVVKVSKFGKAALLAALTTPFVLSVALLSFYKNRAVNNSTRSLLERRKSVRFNDSIILHETKAIEPTPTPLPTIVENKQDMEIASEVDNLLIEHEPKEVEIVVKEERSPPMQKFQHNGFDVRDSAELKKIQGKKPESQEVDTARWERLQQRQDKVLSNLKVLQDKVERLERLQHHVEGTVTVTSEVERRVLQLCHDMGLRSAKMYRVPSDYYDRTLEQRRDILKAASIHHLCKSIILENTCCINSDCSDPNNSRFYCVILQYTARLQSHKVFKFVRSLVKDAPKKNYHFAYAKEQDSLRLTGFEHNAISPVGTTVKIPIILSHQITLLQPKNFFMGGGEVELKLFADVDQLIRVVKPFVADVTMGENDKDE